MGHRFLIELGSVLKPTLKWVVKKWAESSSILDNISGAALVFVGMGVGSGQLSGPPLAQPQCQEVYGVH